MSSFTLNRRYSSDFPKKHVCEEWLVKMPTNYGDEITYRITFKLTTEGKPCFEAEIQTPSGRFKDLNRRHAFARIQILKTILNDEYKEYIKKWRPKRTPQWKLKSGT